VSLIPLSEWSGINADNGRFGQGLGTDQLVTGWIVDNIDDTGLSGDGL